MAGTLGTTDKLTKEKGLYHKLYFLKPRVSHCHGVVWVVGRVAVMPPRWIGRAAVGARDIARMAVWARLHAHIDEAIL